MKTLNFKTSLLAVASIIAFSSCANSTFKNENVVVAGKDVIKDSMQFLQNDRIKLGIDLNLGGAVTFLSDKENGGLNMINSYDWGRQIQMSYYSGPWPYIGPKGETPTPEWQGLGWNPIQSGDAGNHRSKLISFERRGENSLFVRSIPMQWPHKSGVACECEFQTLYTLKDNIITMEATIVNNRSDTTQYRACTQEMPAIYTNGVWYQVVSYLGDKPFQGEATTIVVDKNDGKGWPWVNFYTPENWVALLDSKGMGIGVFQPEVMRFNAGFHPNDATKGFGGEKDGQTGHIAPIGTQILDHNIKWTYKTTFILGNEEQIRNYAKENRIVKTNPSWSFEDSRHMWYYEGECQDKGFPISEGLDITFKKGAKIVSPITYWKAEDNSYLEFEANITGQAPEMNIVVEVQPVGKSDFTDWLNWSEGNSSVEAEKKAKEVNFPKTASISLTQKINSDGSSQKYRVPLKDIPGYSGPMKGLKIALQDQGTAIIKNIKLIK
ncbi:hypothetical protein ACFRAE_03520 [Sphingobacterium sp. HJSM2_6]|uniref:hypothetical protein n=1 Tax=Sphingobacterium sp. HJSM2_6 TaxID=3366264 RepID=UPI003BDFC0DD